MKGCIRCGADAASATAAYCTECRSLTRKMWNAMPLPGRMAPTREDHQPRRRVCFPSHNHIGGAK